MKIAKLLFLVLVSAVFWSHAEALRIDPAAKEYYNKGILHFKQGNYAEAVNDFTSAIAIYPQYEQAFHQRALSHEKLGNTNQAISDYDQVVRLNPKNSQAFMLRGHLNSKVGMDDEAIKDYTKVIELDARNYEAHYERGLIYNIMGLYAEALRDFEKCTQIKPGAEIDYMTGTVESKLGNEEKAIHFFTNAIKYDKANKNFYFHRADSKLKIGRYKEAMEDLRVSQSLDKDQGSLAYVYHRLGLAFHHMQTYDSALLYFNKAIELNPVVNDFLYHRAKTNFHLKNYDEAIKDYSTVIELSPDNLDPIVSRAQVYTAMGKYAEAEADYTKYIEMNPYNFYIFQKRADVRLSQKNFEGALADLNALIELKPENASAYFNRGMLEFNLDRKNDACKDFKKSDELGYKESNDLLKKTCE
ncbi:MAG: tetratricopeptide repeat protein [Cytophagaceae bacterium]|jgi:tetratricopeptide (TPR) repeat protein|nr:tetratricopeptide repeat protein [Cytophagaceae bacterium]